MNNKKFKKLLKSKIEKIEIKDFSSEILNSTSHLILEKEEKKSKSWFLPLSGAIAIATTIAICVPLGVFDGFSGNKGLEINKSEIVFSKELLALGNLLTTNEEVSVNKKRSLRKSNQETINYQKIAEDCNHYLLTGEAFIYQEEINVTFENNKDEKYSSYDYKMSVSYVDHKQYEISYLSYFNRKEISSSEVEIEGVFVIDDKDYVLKGEQKKYGEEVELELKVYIKENTYISISNETEVNENEYEYKYFEYDVIVRGVEFSYEVENGRKETEITIIENGSTVSYEFEYFDDTIECEYESDLIETEMQIFVHDEYYLYVFKDKTQVKLNKK